MWKNHCVNCTWEELKGSMAESENCCPVCGGQISRDDVSDVFNDMLNWYIDNIDND